MLLIPKQEQTSTVEQLLSFIKDQKKEINKLKETITTLKKGTNSLNQKEKKPYNESEDRISLQAQKEWGFCLYKRSKPITKTEKKHLEVQAVGLALCIWSENKIGTEDICRHPAMREINSFYFHSQNPNESEKLNTPKKLLKEIVPKEARIKGRKKRGYFRFNNCTSPLYWHSIFRMHQYYHLNKPLQRVFKYTNGLIYLDFHRARIIIKTWEKMLESNYISERFYKDLCVVYFENGKYILGYIFPHSWFAGTLEKFRYDC